MAWQLMAGGAGVPGGDGAGQVEGRLHHGVPALPRHRQPRGQPDKLRRRAHPALGLAALPRPGGGAGVRHPRGRPAHPGHSQQPHRARPGGAGARRAPARPRPQGRRRRRAGGRGPRGRGGALQRAGRIPEDPRQGVPAPPGDGRGGAALPAAHRGHRHRILLAGAVPDGRVREQRRADGRRHPRRRQPRLRPRVRRHGRPLRSQAAVLGWWARHDHVPGCGCVDHGVADRP
ncbi:hypothetical protein D1007_52424 [Hordeum vulgare]|nr:hypothetical protein D1007_52424 [Hordeum vulgare]